MLPPLLSVLAAAALAACFGAPREVAIDGWTADAMEPFISRDGADLFFNSSNAARAATDIYWAKALDSRHFRLQGIVPGANSQALDGVPSLSRDGAFVLISPRAYDALHATIWIGRWNGRAVEDLRPQPALAPPGPGGFNMDAEISADGRRLYFTDNLWRADGPPRRSVFRLARRTAAGWRTDPTADVWFARINTGGLQYAAGLSADELELYFTRLDPGADARPRIMVATRARPTDPFSDPAPLLSLDGFVEAPTVAPDGALYFHKRQGDRFVIMRAERNCHGVSRGVGG